MEYAEHFSSVITVINSCSDRFEFSKIVENLPSVAGIGALVKSLSGVSGVEGEIIREENNEPVAEPMVLEDLKELERRLKGSNETVGSMKYDINNPEITAISNSSRTLFKLMLNTMMTPNKSMFDHLRRDYLKKSPLDYAFSFISSIESDSTNPIVYAMNLDRFKTKATFEKWSNFIDSILSQLLFLETFCCGIFHDQKMHTAELLKQEIEGMNLKIEDLKNFYKKDSSYWQYIKHFVYEIQDHNVHLGNVSKSEILQNKLETILTDDSFYVLVYDHCEKSHRHAYHCPDDQTVMSFNRGNCNVTVYRSRHYTTASEAEKALMQTEVENLGKNRIPWSSDYHEILEFIDGVVVHNAGLLSLIRKDRDIAIRAINCVTGPGAYTTVRAGNESQNSVFMFFAGFR